MTGGDVPRIWSHSQVLPSWQLELVAVLVSPGKLNDLRANLSAAGFSLRVSLLCDLHQLPKAAKSKTASQSTETLPTAFWISALYQA